MFTYIWNSLSSWWWQSKVEVLELIQTPTPIPICWVTVNEEPSEEAASCKVQILKPQGFHTLPPCVDQPSEELAVKSRSERPRKRRRLAYKQIRKQYK